MPDTNACALGAPVVTIEPLRRSRALACAAICERAELLTLARVCPSAQLISGSAAPLLAAVVDHACRSSPGLGMSDHPAYGGFHCGLQRRIGDRRTIQLHLSVH